MTDQPTPDDPDAAEPAPKKGRGCFLGGLTVVAAVIGSIVVGIFSQATVFACEFECYSAILLITPILLIALLVGAGLLWRKTPGFLLGIGVTVALAVVVPTACSALLSQ